MKITEQIANISTHSFLQLFSTARPIAVIGGKRQSSLN